MKEARLKMESIELETIEVPVVMIEKLVRLLQGAEIEYDPTPNSNSRMLLNAQGYFMAILQERKAAK